MNHALVEVEKNIKNVAENNGPIHLNIPLKSNHTSL